MGRLNPVLRGDFPLCLSLSLFASCFFLDLRASYSVERDASRNGSGNLLIRGGRLPTKQTLLSAHFRKKRPLDSREREREKKIPLSIHICSRIDALIDQRALANSIKPLKLSLKSYKCGLLPLNKLRVVDRFQQVRPRKSTFFLSNVRRESDRQRRERKQSRRKRRPFYVESVFFGFAFFFFRFLLSRPTERRSIDSFEAVCARA